MELTEVDRAEIAAALLAGDSPIAEKAYRAGLAAGIERAAQRCDELAKLYGIFSDGRPTEVCAQYIRDLVND